MANNICAACGAYKLDHIYYPGQPLRCPRLEPKTTWQPKKTTQPKTK